MVTEELLSFIRESNAKGIFAAEIKKYLLESGWSAVDINQAFVQLNIPQDFHSENVADSNAFLAKNVTSDVVTLKESPLSWRKFFLYEMGIVIAGIPEQIFLSSLFQSVIIISQLDPYADSPVFRKMANVFGVIGAGVCILSLSLLLLKKRHRMLSTEGMGRLEYFFFSLSLVSLSFIGVSAFAYFIFPLILPLGLGAIILAPILYLLLFGVIVLMVLLVFTRFAYNLPLKFKLSVSMAIFSIIIGSLVLGLFSSWLASVQLDRHFKEIRTGYEKTSADFFSQIQETYFKNCRPVTIKFDPTTQELLPDNEATNYYQKDGFACDFTVNYAGDYDVYIGNGYLKPDTEFWIKHGYPVDGRLLRGAHIYIDEHFISLPDIGDDRIVHLTQRVHTIKILSVIHEGNTIKLLTLDMRLIANIDVPKSTGLDRKKVISLEKPLSHTFSD